SPTLSWSQLQVLGINDGPRTVPNVRVRVDDGHAHVVDSPVTTLIVTNAPPVLDTLSATSANENGTVHLTGTYHDVDTQDTHTLTINPKFGVPFRPYPGSVKELRSMQAAKCSQEYFLGGLARCER